MWRMKPPSRTHLYKRRQTKNAKEILEKLRTYLDNENAEPIKILCGFWKDQQDAITYQELRVLVEQGYLDEVTARLWQQDYSVLVTERMPKIWGDAMIAGSISQPVMDKALSVFTFNTQTPGVVEWMRSRGAALVTSSTQTQKDAISLLLEEKIREKYTVDELARLIRPTIGLYRQQTSAVEKYYSNMVENLTKDHPRTKPEVIRQRALTQSTKYAERLHRQRAMTIAQTEMAYAYNYGTDEGIRQAQADFLIGKVDKKWCTSGDDNVCPECEQLDGAIIGMDEIFFSGNKTEYDISGLYPPLHPRCACAVEYIETEAPTINGVPVRSSDEEEGILDRAKTYYDDVTRYDPPISLESITGDFTDEVRDLAINAPGVFGTIMDSLKSNIVFAKIDALGKIRESSNGIFSNLSNDAVNSRGPFTSVFHEMGHAIDRALGRPSEAIGLSQLVADDAEDFVLHYAKSQNLTRDDAVAELAQQMRRGSRRETHVISDLMSGVFGNTYGWPSAHSDEYWQRDSGRLGREAYAHFWSASSLDYADKINAIRYIFPNAYRAFLKSVKEATKYV